MHPYKVVSFVQNASYFMLGMALLLGHYAQVAEGGVIPYT
jgi:hypothetical protein